MKINNLCGTLIDEYEDDNITQIEDLQRCKIIISDLIEGVAEKKILVDFQKLVKEAIKRNTGLFFFF
jgi:hypothetical protein